jgi:hypothetical protein
MSWATFWAIFSQAHLANLLCTEKAFSKNGEKTETK